MDNYSNDNYSNTLEWRINNTAIVVSTYQVLPSGWCHTRSEYIALRDYCHGDDFALRYGELLKVLKVPVEFILHEIRADMDYLVSLITSKMIDHISDNYKNDMYHRPTKTQKVVLDGTTIYFLVAFTYTAACVTPSEPDPADTYYLEKESTQIKIKDASEIVDVDYREMDEIGEIARKCDIKLFGHTHRSDDDITDADTTDD